MLTFMSLKYHRNIVEPNNDVKVRKFYKTQTPNTFIQKSQPIKLRLMGKLIQNFIKKSEILIKHKKFFQWKVSTHFFGEKLQMNINSLN